MQRQMMSLACSLLTVLSYGIAHAGQYQAEPGGILLPTATVSGAALQVTGGYTAEDYPADGKGKSQYWNWVTNNPANDPPQQGQVTMSYRAFGSGIAADVTPDQTGEAHVYNYWEGGLANIQSFWTDVDVFTRAEQIFPANAGKNETFTITSAQTGSRIGADAYVYVQSDAFLEGYGEDSNVTADAGSVSSEMKTFFLLQ
jgi:hypothetical protein